VPLQTHQRRVVICHGGEQRTRGGRRH
jgi:hypothetical protein